VDVAQSTVEVRQILERLNGKNDIELGVPVRRRCNIRLATLGPSELGTASLRCGNLIGADVDCMDPTRRPDKSGGLMRVIATSATQLQHPLAGPQILRLEDYAAADDQVMRLGDGPLQPRHIAGERKRVHDASYDSLLFAACRHNASTMVPVSLRSLHGGYRRLKICNMMISG
jgi:hypothetical protein